MPEDVKPQKMSDDEVLHLVSAHEAASLGSPVAAGSSISSVIFPSNQQMTTLQIDRFNALNMYWGRPLGNEVENRSQVVLPELRDTVEWIMPQLMRMFAGSKQMCRFEPEGQTDIEQAAAESDAVNHIFMKENNGFFVLYDYFKDALLLRNGYARVDWIEEKVSGIERYSGLTEDEAARVAQSTDGNEVEVLEQREYPMGPDEAAAMATQTPQPPPMQGGAALPLPQPMCFDMKIRRVEKKGRVKVVCVPSEEMRVSPRTRGSLEDCPFAAQITLTPRSDLIADGHKRSVIDALSPGKPAWLDMDELARNELTDQLSTEDPAAFAMQEIEVRNVVMPLDRDGDGIAELRALVIAGDKILEDEEVEETIFTSCVPKRMPHRHTGISLYDEIVDIQVIKTQLFRGGLDNLALANNSRTGVDWRNCNLDDLLTSRPGGVVRTNGNPGGVLMPLQQPSNMIDQVIPAMQYVDSLREMRTGVGRTSMGLDADELANVTKGGQLASMSAASLKIEMIARLLAEGAKDIFTKIHNCILRHQDKPFEFEVSGKWVKADPTSWKRRTKCTVMVGLGSGNREEARANLALMGQMQGQIAQFGLVGPMQAYETFKRGCEVLGFDNPSQFAMDPKSPEYAQHQQMMKQNPPPPTPQVQAAQIRSQTVQTQEQGQTQRALLDAKVDLTKAQTAAVTQKASEDRQMAHQQSLSDQQMAHDVMQGHQDRQTDAMGMESQAGIALLKIIGQIVASQLKQNATADAGAIVKKDYQELRS